MFCSAKYPSIAVYDAYTQCISGEELFSTCADFPTPNCCAVCDCPGVCTLTPGRRLVTDPVYTTPPPPPSTDRNGATENATATNATEATNATNAGNAPLSRHAARVRALTRAACLISGNSASERWDARVRAATLWSALSDNESKVACWDCVLNRSGFDCMSWFSSQWGLDGSYEGRRRAEGRRKLREAEERHGRLRASLEEHLNKVCCARSRSRPWEPERCGIEFCRLHVQRTAYARIGHTLRRLHEREHPHAAEMPPTALLAADLIAPKSHSIAECRHDSMHGRDDSAGGPSDLECATRSLLHHVASKHGVDPATVHAAFEKVGMNAADVVLKAAQFAGFAQTGRSGEPPRSPHSHSGHDEPDDAAATVGVAVDAASGGARRLEENGDGRNRGPARQSLPLKQVGRAMALGNNWSRASGDYLDRMREMALRRRAAPASSGRADGDAHGRARRLSHQGRAAAVRTAGSSSLNSATASTGAALLLSINSSFARRVGGALGAAQSLYERARHLSDEYDRRQAELAKEGEVKGEPGARRGRGLRVLRGARLRAAIDALYAPLEGGRHHVHAHPHTHPHTHSPTHRNLASDETSHVLNFPSWHSSSWLLSAVDWPQWAAEVERIAAADTHKMRWWMDGAEGTLPAEARTGHRLLDARVPPSTIGRALRILAHDIRGEEAEWETLGRHRRLESAIAAPSPLWADGSSDGDADDYDGGGFNWLHLLRASYAPYEASESAERAARLLERRDHRTNVRMMSEGFLEGTLAAPYAFRETVTAWGVYPESSESFFEAAIRYILYDTLLCYLYPDTVSASETQTGTDSASSMEDGTTIKTHHSNRACFPQVPFLIPRIPSFREATNTEGVDFNKLSYNETCHTETIQAGFDALKELNLDLTHPFAPAALVLRSGEAVDAMRNFVGTGTAETSRDAAALLLCGIMQLGGILYVAILLPFVGIILICALPFTSITMCCITCCRSRLRGRLAAEAYAAQTDEKQRLLI